MNESRKAGVLRLSVRSIRLAVLLLGSVCFRHLRNQDVSALPLIGTPAATLSVAIVIAVLFILTLRKALERCAPQNRTTSPDSAWLLLIPLFNMVWGFILYPRISESLEREFRSRNLPIEPQPAKSLGLALAILQVCCIIPFVGVLAGIGALICFIMYWVKISGYSNRLGAGTVYSAQTGQSLQS